MPRHAIPIALCLACALLLASAAPLGAAPAKPAVYMLPDTAKSTWLVLETYIEDASFTVPYKDTYVEVWQTTGQRQGPAFSRAYGISKYDLNEKFLFYVFRLLNNGRVFQVNLETPGSTGVCLVDGQGQGVFKKEGSIYDNPQMPAWAATASRQPKTFHPMPVLVGAKDMGVQKLDVFPRIPGKETTAHRYRLMDGRHVFIKYFPNRTVWGYDLIALDQAKSSFWGAKWNRSYGRKGGKPQPDFASYGLSAP